MFMLFCYVTRIKRKIFLFSKETGHCLYLEETWPECGGAGGSLWPGQRQARPAGGTTLTAKEPNSTSEWKVTNPNSEN